MVSLLTGLMMMTSGCASYATPGRGADMAMFGMTDEQREDLTDSTIRRQLERQPLASFPAAIAVVRVQDPQYRGNHDTTYGRGKFTVVTSRDVETEEQFERLSAMPMVRGIAPINRLILPSELQSDRDLRQAAATLHADITLIYTIDTTFRVGSQSSPIDVITFGFLPSKRAYVTTTASAVFMDTRNGYVYGLAEASDTANQLANTWTSSKAVEDVRSRTEAKAMAMLVDDLERAWGMVLRAQSGAASIKVE
jgi:hypothetical protein